MYILNNINDPLPLTLTQQMYDLVPEYQKKRYKLITIN